MPQAGPCKDPLERRVCWPCNIPSTVVEQFEIEAHCRGCSGARAAVLKQSPSHPRRPFTGHARHLSMSRFFIWWLVVAVGTDKTSVETGGVGLGAARRIAMLGL